MRSGVWGMLLDCVNREPHKLILPDPNLYFQEVFYKK